MEISKETELETKIAYLEKGLEDMSQIVYQQQKDLDLLQRQMRAMSFKLKQAQEIIPELGELLENQRPPHY